MARMGVVEAFLYERTQNDRVLTDEEQKQLEKLVALNPDNFLKYLRDQREGLRAEIRQARKTGDWFTEYQLNDVLKWIEEQIPEIEEYRKEWFALKLKKAAQNATRHNMRSYPVPKPEFVLEDTESLDLGEGSYRLVPKLKWSFKGQVIEANPISCSCELFEICLAENIVCWHVVRARESLKNLYKNGYNYLAPEQAKFLTEMVKMSHGISEKEPKEDVQITPEETADILAQLLRISDGGN